jgi:hypothetical protein
MNITEQDVKLLMRRTLNEVARRLDIGDPEHMEENQELLPAVEHRDKMAYRVMGAFRSAYRRWFDKSLELERAASQGIDLTTVRMEVMGLMKERDVTREAMIRYLDHKVPRSTSRVAV